MFGRITAALLLKRPVKKQAVPAGSGSQQMLAVYVAYFHRIPYGNTTLFETYFTLLLPIAPKNNVDVIQYGCSNVSRAKQFIR